MAGGELFTRTPRGVQPTPLGEFVLSKAHRVLGEMEALAAGARAAAAGPLRLGSIVPVMLGALVAELDELLPGRQTTVDGEDSVTALTRLLGSGHYDAILYGEVPATPRGPGGTGGGAVPGGGAGVCGGVGEQPAVRGVVEGTPGGTPGTDVRGREGCRRGPGDVSRRRSGTQP
ncbi:hypothetical protein OG946_31020 [Streptomyces sp. NBC_01808]|uniref:hypothetical protein n=1 Tax=Streptomyces sp. NBC_01808 TaxID=2975947 RepID=UPI002DDC4E27|nr:hypothetical protein [Streptomyces sp. NBC_01808]WSA41427.1 hypothetical protein OG946_31020 [Streptomyces sp. NBC_01808]